MYIEVHGGPYDGTKHRFADDIDNPEIDPNTAWVKRKIEQGKARAAGIPIEPDVPNETEWMASHFSIQAFKGDRSEFVIPSPQAFAQIVETAILGNFIPPGVMHRYVLTSHKTFGGEIHAEFAYLGEAESESDG